MMPGGKIPDNSSLWPRNQSTVLPVDQPQRPQMERTQEHLMQRPLTGRDQEQISEFMDQLNVTFGDYAPGGENMPGWNEGKTRMT